MTASRPERLPPLHVVTDDGVLGRTGWLEVAREVLRAGGPGVALHLRGTRASGRELWTLAHTLEPLARDAGALLTVNDRVDVSLAVGLEAVHLGQRSLLVEDARAVMGPDALLGVSCHDEGELGAARSGGAGYGFVGHVFDTPSHPGRPGRGADWLAAMARSVAPWPVFAIGGVTPERATEVLTAGAAGVAVIRSVWDDPDPPAAVRGYIAALARHPDRAVQD